LQQYTTNSSLHSQSYFSSKSWSASQKVLPHRSNSTETTSQVHSKLVSTQVAVSKTIHTALELNKKA